MKKTDPCLPVALILVGLVLCGFGYSIYHEFFHDDAYISLRYAHNLLDGQGLVWNAGERVEGYSNFLWVLLVSVLGLIGFDLVTATKILGVASFILIALVCWLWGRRLIAEDATSAAIAVLLALSSLPMIVWSVGGLETVFFALLLLLSLWAVFEASVGKTWNAILAGLLLSLLAITRPDGLIYFCASLFWLMIQIRKDERVKSRIGLIVLTVGICIGAFLLWRWNYYGDLWPNPYYVKGVVTTAHFLRGLRYLLDFSLSPPLLLPMTLISFVLIWRLKRWQTWLGLTAIVLSVHFLYVAMVGGDHMPAFRFLAPIIPLCAMVIAAGVRAIAATYPRTRASLVIAALVALAVAPMIFPPEPVYRARMVDGAAFQGRIVGEYIDANFPRGSLIALNTAGSTPYYAPQHRFIDMLGLNDRTIAKRKDLPVVARWQEVPGHEKGDGAYVLSRRPDYVIAGGAVGYAITMNWFLTEYELARMPEFNAQYKPVAVMLPVRQYPGYENYEESKTGEMGFIYYQRVK